MPQPPQPNQPSAPYGSPYGQPAAPYGQPPAPAPYGQQPYGQPHPYGSWGVPPMGPPPRKRRVGLILGIVGGVIGVVVVALLAIGLVASKSTAGFPEATYKLTIPKTLLDGKYELTKDLSDTEGKQIEDEADGAWDARDTKAAVGQYARGGDQAKGAVVVSGMYGRFKNTDLARKNMMSGAAQGAGATVAVRPKDFKPSGSDVTITCQVLTKSQLGGTTTLPMCGWADGNTGATVAEITPEIAAQDPSDVDLNAAAETAAKIRSEIRKPIG